MTSWYEFEELVGKRWHHWAARTQSYESFPEAGAELAELRDSLSVYFHAVGGPRSVAVTTATAASSGHRLSLRQRLGLEREPMELARRDEESLVLPRRIEYFDDPDLNRDLYFWLAAFLAEARPVERVRDPLQSDLLELAECVRASRAVTETFPGLQSRYRRLCQALLTVRPHRRLPGTEASLEAVILHLLGAEVEFDEIGRRMLSAVAALPADDVPTGPAGPEEPARRDSATEGDSAGGALPRAGHSSRNASAASGPGLPSGGREPGSEAEDDFRIGAVGAFRAPRKYHPPLPVPL